MVTFGIQLLVYFFDYVWFFELKLISLIFVIMVCMITELNSGLWLLLLSC